MSENKNTHKEYSFPQKIWITGSVFSLIVVLILLLNATFSVFILILAGALIALFFRGISGFIERKLNWHSKLSISVSVIGSFIVIGLLFWLMGAKVQAQVNELSETLPVTIQNAEEKLNETDLGKKLVDYLSSPKTQEKVKSLASTFLKSSFGILGNIYVIIFMGIFFTVSPKVYYKGIIKLIPYRGREKGEEVVKKIGNSLKKWLKGKIFAMFVVFVLTAIGLYVLDIDMWLVLALIAGGLNFIPNFGPLLAMIPALLVAFMQGPTTTGLVAGLYILVQFAESNFITPLIQKKLIQIPPALIIIAQLFVGSLTGIWGIILATPLMVVILILVKELYVKKNNKPKA